MTNFNSYHLEKILSNNIEISSIQVQYSLLDRRPEKTLIKLAKNHNVKILSYGVLSGGFLSNKWLDKKEPVEFKNRSLIKYKLIIDEYGGWNKFQNLLRLLDHISSKHNISISELILIYMLKYTSIDAIILGISLNFEQNPLELITKISLSEQEVLMISLLCDYFLSGDVYDLERERNGPHYNIMKYNLNEN